MADLFAACLAFTLAQEGGHVDDSYDPGGATNMGITLATYQHWDQPPQRFTRTSRAAVAVSCGVQDAGA